MPLKVKELKDDAMINIECSKSLYVMLKNAIIHIFNNDLSNDDPAEHLKIMTSNDYAQMSDAQRAFYTLALLIAQFEQKATEGNLFEEKIIPEPGDPDYEEPTVD